MGENAGSIYAELTLEYDKLEAGMQKIQAKINTFDKNINKQAKQMGGNFGRGLKSGFDMAGRGAVLFGKTLAMAFGPVGLALSLVSAAVMALKNAFSDAASKTAGFTESVAQLSSFFKDKLLAVVTLVANATASLLSLITSFITKTTEAERIGMKILNDFSDARLKAQKDYEAAVKKTNEQEKAGMIDKTEAEKQIIEARKAQNNELIEGGLKATKDAENQKQALIEKFAEKEKQLLKELENAEINAQTGGLTRAAIQAQIDANRVTAQNEIAKLTEMVNKETQANNAIVKKNADENKRSEKALLDREKALKKQAETEALFKKIQEQINSTKEKTIELEQTQNIQNDKSLTDRQKQIGLLNLKRDAELKAVEAQYASIASTEKGRDQIEKLKQEIKAMYAQQEKGIKDTEAGKEKWKMSIKDMINIYAELSNSIISVMQTIADANRKKTEEQIENIDEELEAEKNALEERRQRALEEAGFSEALRAEDMQAQIDAAVEAGDEILQYQLLRKQEEKRINEFYDAQVAEAEKKAAKEKAELEYKQAVEDWKLKIIEAVNGTALAVINGLQVQPILPLGLAMAAMAGALGAVQVGSLKQNPPKPPQFATGGIVPGNSFAGDKVPALVNSGELILNQAQQDNIAGQLGGGGNSTATIIVQLDAQKIGEATFKLANNGMYYLKATAVI
jgi:hypothetical protein